MYIQALKNLVKSRRLRQADVARAAGVSRAAVTKWFASAEKSPEGWANLETVTLRNLAEGLGIKPEQLLRPPPDLSGMGSRFLWDHLYDSMEDFAKALARRELAAVGRLAQVLGFREAGRIVGKDVYRKFPDYKKYLKPVRRKELEILWPLYHSPR